VAISEEFAVASDLPCADSKYLVALKRSPEFRELRPRLAGSPPHPVADSWLDDGFHFFVFALKPEPNGDGRPREAGAAVFAMHPESPEPVSAITVIPTPTGEQAEITNLSAPTGSYIAPLPPGAGSNVPR
jgi:hypothetical protein